MGRVPREAREQIGGVFALSFDQLQGRVCIKCAAILQQNLQPLCSERASPNCDSAIDVVVPSQSDAAPPTGSPFPTSHFKAGRVKEHSESLILFGCRFLLCGPRSRRGKGACELPPYTWPARSLSVEFGLSWSLGPRWRIARCQTQRFTQDRTAPNSRACRFWFDRQTAT